MNAADPHREPEAPASPIQLAGSSWRALETARKRLVATGLIFVVAFLLVAFRLVDLAAFGGGRTQSVTEASFSQSVGRGNIVDRNGTILAISLPFASVYADPREVPDAKATVRALAQVLPNIDKQALEAKLSGPGRFVWIRRNLAPEQQHAVNRLGLPGLAFDTEYRRVYPQGRTAAHALGLTNVDELGIAGIEQAYDALLSNGETVRLSLDVRLQHLMRQELAAAVSEYRAIGAAGVVLDAATGEVLAMVSLPDFDPNAPAQGDEEARFNRVTKGVYEMGSVFKLFTAATALDAGVTSLEGGYDASRPLRVSRHVISDYHAKNRWLSVPEIIVHSSNIGAALMAHDVGTARLRQYLESFGLLTPVSMDVPEVGEPLVPNPWREINTLTVGFGHGIAVTPLQLVAGVAALVNGGYYRPATLLRQDDSTPVFARRVLSSRTSAQIRALMRLVVRFGTGTKSDVAGYEVGGKTGTAEKLVSGHYRRDQRVSSFVGAFPMDKPRFVIFAMIDEPKGNRATYGYATGGWVAAPVVGRIIGRMAPFYGIAPLPDSSGTATASRSRQEQLVTAIRQVIANDKGRQIAAR